MKRPLLRLALALALTLFAGSSCALFSFNAKAEAVRALIVDGRVLLDANRPDEAQVVFEQAVALDDNSLGSRVWLLRSWMDQGRTNDTLDAIDALSKTGKTGPEIDYLYGMAFARRAQGKVAMGDVDGSVQMNFEDAVGLLNSAVEADPERFKDAYPALAESAWMALDLPLARDAAEAGVEAFPARGDDELLLGRIAFSQFREAYDAAGEIDATAEAHWQVARNSFQSALTKYGSAEGEGQEFVLADAQVQLANAMLWKEDTAAASEAYAAAIGLAPEAVDFAQVRGLFEAALFRDTLVSGLASFETRLGPETGRTTALIWWIGYAQFAADSNVEAEAAFQRALALEPAYVNAWFYTALARYGEEDWAGTVDALRSGWNAEPSAIVAEMQTNLDLNLSKVSYVVAWCAAQERLEDAAFLSRVNAESALHVPTYWSDLGLFLRDRGASLGLTPEAMALHEEAFEAYKRALELSPEDPQIMNDTAVMLHYYLQRDLDTALLMYGRAKELAQAQLDSGELSEEHKPITETALRDATENATLLQEALSLEATERG